jgi:ubiquinone/menaquinone biosynthesis C-methylase UbiE
MIPDWQLPPGVDRGLWDYLHSEEMVAKYDTMMAESPLATADLRFCQEQFPRPGNVIDLGCGTGRLCRFLAEAGYSCVGVDLSDEMLQQARQNAPTCRFVKSNLVDLAEISDASFDYAACLFSTLGMIRGEEHRRGVLKNVHRVLKPDGSFVLHVHNRWFHALGWRRFRSGDLTMRQAYAGAPLTLHHYSKSEIIRALSAAKFAVMQIQAVGRNTNAQLALPGLFTAARAYGYLISAKRIV